MNAPKQLPEFFLAKPYAHTMVDCPTCGDGVRIFKDSPETVCLQIRTMGPITHGRNGKARPAYSSVGLTFGDLNKVIKELTALRDALPIKR